MNKNLSREEQKQLDNWVEELENAEMSQAQDLIDNCNISFQFAKTHSVYVKDWEKTKQKMEDQLRSGNLPSGVSKELFREMIDSSNEIINKKLEKVRSGFQEKFGESIYSYIGKDGKTKNVFNQNSKTKSVNKTEASKQEYNKYAVSGFILSLFSIIGIDLLGIIGLILGVVALSEIQHTDQQGKGLAVSAVIIGLIFGLVADFFQAAGY